MGREKTGRRRCVRVWILVLVFVLAGTGLHRAAAQISSAPSETISQIRIDGAQRIEPDTVRSYLSLRVGDRFDPVRLDQSLKSLFATGLFADVTLTRQGSVLIVRVVENPIINRIAFEGNKRIEDKILQSEIQLRPRIVYTRSRVQSDVQRIVEIYRRSGRFGIKVTPKVIQLEQNRVDLVFEITEGDLTEIRRITFVGNNRFSDSRLREVIRTKESAWYRFLSSDDVYDPDRLTFDRELLRRFYLANGYADFRVVSAVAELSPDQEAFYVTFTLEEGERYRFGKIDINVGLRNLGPEKLREFLTVEEGDWYDADQVEETIKALTDAVGSLGYAFVDIRPQVRRKRDKKIVDVTFNVREGPRVFLERIDIVGNLRTIDPVIRREFQLVEGDAFNTAKLRESRRRIQNLGFFDKVEVTNVPGSAPDRTVVKVQVQEKSTGELSFGAGVSTDAGLLGDISLRERNLLGRGQDLKLSTRLGQKLSTIDLSFTEPYLLGHPLSGGVDLFSRQFDQQSQSSFDKTELGFGLRSGYRLADNLTQSWRYTLRQQDVTNVASDASAIIKSQEGKSTVSSISHGILFDRRDNRFQPREGYFVRETNEFAGIGGTVRYLRNSLQGGLFFPIGDKSSLGFTAEGGHMFGIGQDVRVIDSFFLGGNNFRGFAQAGVGPRDVNTDDALGGTWFWVQSSEFTFPLGLPSEFNILGSLFLDVGSSGGTDASGPSVMDTGSLRLSAGFGLSWRSPFGPLRVDLGRAILKEEFDDTQIFRFNFGTRF